MKKHFKATVAAFTACALFLSMVGCSNNTTTPNDPNRPTGTLYINGDTDARTYSIDLNSGSTTNLFSGVNAFRTPDGTFIVCTADGLQEVSADGTTSRMIVPEDTEAPFDQTFDDAFKNPQLSPDGQYIAYEGHLGYEFDVYVVDRGTGALLLSLNHPDIGEGFSRPSWTQDGRLVVAGTSGIPGIYITSNDWSTLTRIDDNLTNPKQPMVSPNGQQIAFIMNDHVYTMNIDGSGLQQITTSSSDEGWPTWSPDGKSLAFYGNDSILLFELSSGDVFDVSSISTALRNFISFTAYRDGQFQWN